MEVGKFSFLRKSRKWKSLIYVFENFHYNSCRTPERMVSRYRVCETDA